MERQITISIEEYNKLIDMHTKREELPEKIEVKKFTSKWWRWLKRASCSLLHYNKNAEQQKLIKRCINEMSSVLLDNLYGYWRGDLSDYLKERGHLEYFMRRYKDDAYNNIMKWLDKKQRMRLKKKEKLTAYWDKKENCIGAYHPLGFMTKTDAHYLFDNVFTKEFVKEMTDRGYDVTTMKFEISPKLPNYERFNDLSKKYYGKEKQRMKKQIILDEQDIKELHEDAEHLRWLYNRMVCEHGESVNFDYMHRFAKIFNKLKQLQRMKIESIKFKAKRLDNGEWVDTEFFIIKFK